jgi:hypothetical protein
MTTIEDIKTELRDIIEFSDKATPGPWEHGSESIWSPNSRVCGEAETDDMIFVCSARNLTPKMAKALLTAIQVLEGMAQPLNCECSDEALRAYDQDSAIAKEALETIRREWEAQA